MKSFTKTIQLIIFVVLLNSASIFGQWVEQTISLDPGWNAVYLEVQPEPQQCDVVFGAMNIESVWYWNPKSTSAQYISSPPDPNTLMVSHTQWLVYFPPEQPAHISTNLFNLIGGKAYLIKLGGTEQVQWTIKGHPCLPKIDWKPGTYNFSGYHISGAGQEPTFLDFFSGSSAHLNRPIYRLVKTGGNFQWEVVDVDNPLKNTMKKGEAYWTSSQWSSDYIGPLAVVVEQAGELAYGESIVQQKLTIHNFSDNDVTVDMSSISSLSPPDGSYDPVAGNVPHMYWKSGPVEEAGWVELPGSLALEIPPESNLVLRLAVNRSEMPTDGSYQSILEFDNNQGMTLNLSASAQSTDFSGLWVGYAAIENVSQPSDETDPNEVKSTASEFQFPVIMHVDPNDNIYLLKEVVQLWKDPVMGPDPNSGDPNSDDEIVIEPGRFVLVTDPEIFQQFSGASLRDGQPRGRRISSAAFSFPDPIKMTGNFGLAGNALNLDSPLTIGPDDPLNPFRHKFHPDHDDAAESFQVKRDITFKFTSSPPEGPETPGWGDSDVGGEYTETITGIHEKSINVKGIFHLHRVSRIGVLNDSM